MKWLLNSFVLIFTLLFFFNTGYTAEDLEEKEELDTEKPLSLTETYTLTNSLPKKLIDLQKQIDELFDTNDIFAHIQKINSKAEDLEWETTTATTNPNLKSQELLSLEAKLTKLAKQVAKLNRRIESNVHALEILSDEWFATEVQLQKFSIQTTAQSNLPSSLPTVDSLEQIVKKAQNLIEKKIQPTLLAGREMGEIQAKIYTLNDTVNTLLQDFGDFGFQQTSPSILSAGFYSRLDHKILNQSIEDFALFSSYQKGYLKNNFNGVLIYLASIIIVAVLTRISRTLVKASYRWRQFTDKPLATGIFLVSTIFVLIDALHPDISLPPKWLLFLQIPMMFSAVSLARKFIVIAPLYHTISSFLIFSLAAIMFLDAANLPQTLIHLCVLGVSLFCFIYSVLIFFRKKEVHSKRKNISPKVFFLIFPLIVFLAGAAGYGPASLLIFERVLSIIVITLIVWLMQKCITGLLELMLFNIPVSIIRHNAATIVNDISPVLTLAHTVLWFLLTLSLLSIFPTLDEAVSAIVAIEFSLLKHTITPKSILVIIFAIYATFLTSRGINTFLIKEILPRYRVSRGVQESITRLVHYTIIIIGFLVLLNILGFKLGDIAIIGGALGVGIGFGLKEIVNNFVSGLILLFERPVKVGDVIVVGQDMGEVTTLGLRATTVQTFDNAEIVIPNAELITSSVTNWTLAEKRVRIKIPIGVAYGTDISNVLKILLSCADSNPTVLTKPPPRALFLDFGDSSLNFELRAWISDFNDSLMVRSELNQDIENEFQIAGIEIPFPQRDLHLKSVDIDTLKAFQKVTINGSSE